MGSSILRRVGWRSGLLLAVLVLGACATLQWKPQGPRRTSPIENAEAVGAEECGVCHEDVQGHEKIAGYHSDCESCHGLGSIHVESEEAGDIRYPANADCLDCHAAGYANHLEWGTGEHSRAGVFCSDCHNPHSVAKRHLREPQAKLMPHADAASQLCSDCHQDVAGEFHFFSHHTVPEGKLSCLSCHDPHEDRRVAFGDRNRTCAGCHQDYMGPWTFEHPPVVEDCTLCHEPHGAVTQNLLGTVQPVICLSCHSSNDPFHHNTTATGIVGNTVITQDRPTAAGEIIKREEANTFLSNCTNCHGAIHGSYTDEHLRH